MVLYLGQIQTKWYTSSMSCKLQFKHCRSCLCNLFTPNCFIRGGFCPTQVQFTTHSTVTGLLLYTQIVLSKVDSFRSIGR